MGFNKRFLSIDSIMQALSKEFNLFNRYMTTADAYLCEDLESSKIWNQYVDSSLENRHKIYLDLKGQYLTK